MEHLPQTAVFSKLERGIIRFGNLLSGLFLVSVIIAVYEVICRFIFDAPTIWVHELTVFFCGICLTYGGLYCVAKKSHISIDVVYRLLKPKGQYILDLFVETAQIIFFAALSFASFIMVEKSWRSPTGAWHLENNGSAFDLPTPALLKAVIFCCALLMLSVAYLRLVRLVRRGPTVFEGG
ncbi:TRAP transporter small permease subunit [Buttiauxella selenatireducens]|uniref:TRAP transporter small permease protein n=1 Tax=Buttiauxella selenatireducens TaxID=3073902 RepID=A0ABY9S634_9ENTR|nr:TRAP transporter small permease subunit [Buttiauxella sp. R73]WMY72596.1 TRAP transporter small permease subunit [Buttiauxella sp. R73]